VHLYTVFYAVVLLETAKGYTKRIDRKAYCHRWHNMNQYGIHKTFSELHRHSRCIEKKTGSIFLSTLPVLLVGVVMQNFLSKPCKIKVLG